MKKYIIILLAATATILCSGQTNKQNLNTNDMTEKIDFDFLEKNAKKLEAETFVLNNDFPSLVDVATVMAYEYSYVLDDGTDVYIFVCVEANQIWENRVPPEFTYWYERIDYLKNGFIKGKGKMIGANNLAFYEDDGKIIPNLTGNKGNGLRIGVWQYYDSKGNIIKKIDYNEQFGTFGYEQVLNFLKERNIIGENYEGIGNVIIEYINYKVEKHHWCIEVPKDFGSGVYRLDGDTGAVLE